MMFKSFLLSTFLFVGMAFDVHADQFKNDPAFQVASVTVSEILPLTPMAELPAVSTNPVENVFMILDKLIAVGTKILPIIKEGKAVITTSFSPTISILPHVEGDNPVLNQMENWSMPLVHSFNVVFKNGVNKKIASFLCTIYFQYNGDLNGVGKYVTNLRVQASEIKASWGFDFEASSEFVGMSNVGSAKAPIASGIIQLTYRVKASNQILTAQSFYVDGLGRFMVLNN